MNANDKEFKPGERVVHEEYGAGVVVNDHTLDQWADTTIIVSFDKILDHFWWLCDEYPDCYGVPNYQLKYEADDE